MERDSVRVVEATCRDIFEQYLERCVVVEGYERPHHVARRKQPLLLIQGVDSLPLCVYSA